MTSRDRHGDDDSLHDIDLDIRKPPTRNHTLLIVLVVVGSLFLLSTCVTAVPIFDAITALFEDPHPAKMHGSWRGQFLIPGRPVDAVYTFRKDGTFRQEELDAQGKVFRVIDAHWQVVNGEVEIDWPDGGVEVATVDWPDNNTMTYTIIDHDDAQQIGLTVTLRRK